MLIHSTDERLALLLTALGEEAATAAFKSIHPTRAVYVRQLLEEFKADPPSREELEFVVNDFNNYFTFALETLGPEVAEAKKTKSMQAKAKAKSAGTGGEAAGVSGGKPELIVFDPIEPTGDIAADLSQLHPFQITKTLESDHPKTIALVLQQIDTPLAAAVLEGLPESKRADAVIFLSQPSTVPQLIINQVLSSTFEKANTIRLKEEPVDHAKALAELMRSLPKDMRKALIERLTEENPELVEDIRSKLYVFDDVNRLDDRDIQKVLGEVETDCLIVGLQRADQELVDKIMGNLSKRARQTIEEEMQYKTGVSDKEVEEAREKLVAAIGRLDEAGEITLK